MKSDFILSNDELQEIANDYKYALKDLKYTNKKLSKMLY
jgi:LysM repeat protein